MEMKLSRACLLLGALAFLVVTASADNITTNTTTAVPEVEATLTWKGIVVLVSVVALITILALGYIGSTAGLFMISLFFYLCGIIKHDQVFAGLVNKGMLSVALMFVIVHPLAHVPVAHKGITMLLSSTSKSKFVPLIKLLLFSWITSPLLENVPHVAVQTPIVTQVCRELGIDPKMMLMSMAHCVVSSNWLILGSASNLIIQALLADSGTGEELGFFELAKTNLPVSFLLLIYFVLAPWFFFKEPAKDANGDQDPSSQKQGKGSHFVVTMQVSPHSTACGQTIKQAWNSLPATVQRGVTVEEVIRAGDKLEVADEPVLEAGDELRLEGDLLSLRSLRVIASLNWVGVPDDQDLGASPLTTGFVSNLSQTSAPATDAPHQASLVMSSPDATATEPVTTNDPVESEMAATVPDDEEVADARPAGILHGQVEGTVVFDSSKQEKLAHFATVVVSRTNPAVSSIVGSHKFSTTYNVAIVAVRSVRGGDLAGESMVNHRLETGDTLLLRAKSANFIKKWRGSSDFYVVESLDKETPLSVIKTSYVGVPDWFCAGETVKPGGKYVKLPEWYPNLSFLVFAGVVIAAMVGVPLTIAAALGVCALVISGLVTVREAISFVDWGVYLTNSFAFGIGFAMTESGLAAWIGKLVIDANVGGYGLMALIAFITSLVACIASNKGAIQVMFPIAISIFVPKGLSMIPASVIIANAAMGGFITTYGISTSLIVAGPGRYTAKDFLFFGTPLLIIYTLLSALITCIVYDFW